MLPLLPSACQILTLTPFSVLQLLPREPPNYRGKVLHLSLIDLEVGIAVPFSQFKQMLDRLLCTHRECLHRWHTWRRSDRDPVIGDFEVIDGLTELQMSKALSCTFLYPCKLLLDVLVYCICPLYAPARHDGNDIG